MENKKILETAGKELEKKISASSSKSIIEGVKSNLLDALILDKNENTRKEFGNPIKEELTKKIEIAKNHKPPRIQYIENMNKVIKDLETRIKGQKTDDSRTSLLDLNKKETFNTAVLRSFVDEILEEAKTKKPIWDTNIFEKLTSKSEHIEEILRQLEHRKDENDTIQKKNIEQIIKTFSKKWKKITKEEMDKENEEETKEKERLKQKAIEEEKEKNKPDEIMDNNLKTLRIKMQNMKNGEEISIPLKNGEMITLKKENEYGWKCRVTTSDAFRKYIENEANVKNSRVSNEDLLKFLRMFFETTKKETKKIKKTRKEKTIPKPIVEPIIEPIPVPPEEMEDLELNAVISDMGTDVHRERVSLETEEELRDEYKKLGRYNMPQRAYLFLSRWAKRKRMIKAKMAAMKGKAFSTTDQALNEKTGDASDRHELEVQHTELQHKLDQVQKANTVTLQNPQVNNLCKAYLKWTPVVTDIQFQTQFNDIIDNDGPIQNILRWQKITHIGTNILEKLKLQKAKWDLSNKIEAEFNKTPLNMTVINAAITQYIKEFQTNPEFMKDYEEFINGVAWARNKLQQYLDHQRSVMQMQATNLKMNIDILVKWKSAYQIDNKDRQKWLKYKIGNVLDKLPRWVQTAGFIGLSVGTGILTWWLGTVAAAAITTWVSASGVGAMNALKKFTHYTKEQNTHEKNVVTDYRQEQAKLAERQNRALNGKRYQWRTYKAKRQLALYDQTTQENIQISNSINDTITDLSSKIGKLDPKEENYMKKNLIQGWARLKYYRESWHNFLASNEKKQIERDMKRLEKSIILWVDKLWITLTGIETMQAIDDLGNNLTYAIVQKDLKSSYDKSLIQFKRERRNLAIKYGIGTAMLSAGMSIGMQYLLGTGIFGGKGTPPVEWQSATLNAKDNFDLGKADLLDTGTKNHIYNTGANVLKDARVVDGSTITLNYGAGTDATQVLAGRLTHEVYTAKIQSVIHNINGMSLDSATKTWLLNHINNHPRQQLWATQNFTNDALHGMRCAELIEQAAKAASDSWRTNLIFHINYDPNLDIVGKTVYNAAERVVNANFTIQTPTIPWTDPSNRWRFIQVPVFFNTFKDRVKGKEPQAPQETPRQPNQEPIRPQEPTKEPSITDKRQHYGETQGKGPAGGHEGKNQEGISIDPNTGKATPEQPISPDSEVGISTRKEQLNDIENFAPEYPVKFKEKSLDEMAQIVLTHPRIRLYEDPQFANDSSNARRLRESGDKKWAIKEIKRIITEERKFIKEDLKKQQGFIDQTYGEIKKVFERYNVKELMDTLPKKDKIHILCKYEFEAYNPPEKNENGWTTVAVCYTDHGHIMINYDFIHMKWNTPEKVGALLKDVLIHELIHDSWINNYHHYYTLKDKNKSASDASNRENEQFIQRRLGLAMIKRIGGKKDNFLAYGIAMNEAVTQMLADEIGGNILPAWYGAWWYLKEKEVIRLIESKFNIPFEMFAKAILNRTKENGFETNALKTLNEKVNGTQTINTQKWFQRPEFMKLIMCVMDFESNQKLFGADYSITKALINWEQVMVTPEMKKFLHPSLLLKDEKTGQYIRAANGDLLIKQSILDAYPNLLDTTSQAIAA